MEYRKKTKYQGLYERVSEKRVYKGKPDVCFDISYKLNGKKIWEKAGWLSEGYSAKLANEIRGERKRNIRHGEELPKEKRNVPCFKDIAAKYLSWAKENKKSWGSDQHRYKNHLAERLDDKRLNEINSFDLERIKSDLTKEELAPATVKHCLVLPRRRGDRVVIASLVGVDRQWRRA